MTSMRCSRWHPTDALGVEIRDVSTKGQALDPTWSTAFGYTVTVEGSTSAHANIS
jgi:hypothetical protein